MMNLTLAEPRLLKESISIISDLVNEVTFKVGKDKIEMLAMDPANVAMVDFVLLSTAFVEYEVDEELTLSVNLEQFKAILRRSKPSDTITLSLDSDKNRLKINLNGANKKTFNLSLLNIDDNAHNVPSLTFGATIQANASMLDEAVEDMSVVAESVAFIADVEKFTVRSESNFSDANVVFPKTEEMSIELAEEGEVSSKYSLEYLKKMIKGSKLTDNVNIYFGNDYPLKIEFVLMDKMKLGFVLAPRVSND
ncbi:MAG: proliferating cell nuclear antigen (pcna) [archaeon]